MFFDYFRDDVGGGMPGESGGGCSGDNQEIAEEVMDEFDDDSDGKLTWANLWTMCEADFEC